MSAPVDKPCTEFLAWVGFVLIVAVLTACVGFGLGGCIGEAGARAAEGAAEYLDSPAGQAKVEAISARSGRAAIQGAKAEIKAEVKADVDEAKRAAEEGRASWWQILLAVAAGSYPVGRALRRKFFGLPANGNGTNGGTA